MYLWVARTLFHPNLCWSITQSIAPRMKRAKDNPKMKTCASFVRLPCIYTGVNDWKKKLFTLLMNKLFELSASRFQGVHTNDIPFAEDLVTLLIQRYDKDIVDGNIIAELGKRSVQKYGKTLKLLKYNNHNFL